MARLCDQYSVDAILFAIANISLKEKNRIINLCAATKKEVNIIPDLYKVMMRFFSFSEMLAMAKRICLLYTSRCV